MVFKQRFSSLVGAKLFASIALIFLSLGTTQAQHSVAREWSEVLLESIRNDFARPTVHARNLFHTSTVMYDAWAAYEPDADTYFLGDSLGNYFCPFAGVPITASNVKAAQEEAMSYAAYRLLKHRFQFSPGATASLQLMDALFLRLGYNPLNTSTQYTTGGPAELGNYLASQMIAFGLQDGSNEAFGYANAYYFQRNSNLAPEISGNPFVSNPNLWQPLSFSVFIDQSGNQFPGVAPPFLSPEWGNVVPFAMQDSQKTTFTRNARTYQVYEDPGAPAYLDSTMVPNTTDDYQWGHALVGVWSSHLDPADTTMWDISPKSIGNLQSYPNTIAGLRSFYNFKDGGDNSTGRNMNPRTGLPYAPQMVSRGDYARVLAEFWADGPDSETPPGHWFDILNYVMDHPLFERRWLGQGPLIDDLEWDVKAYFTMGGTVHDAAVAAWGLKGWYDYARPITALRYMSDRGQSTDPALPNYHPYGIPLEPGYIELVQVGDPLAGLFNRDVNKIKIRSWRGPDYIINPVTDSAGVDWILLENWWPYQRPTFVTPPFAGYVSGHSTFSRAAAEVMTMITGDEYFPGGMGEFVAKQDSFLVFEKGPSQRVTLQWATYRDASDQCSLSRIWGGIHPPVDDIPGRLIGMRLGPQSVNLAQKHFDPNGKVDVIAVTTNVDTVSRQHLGTATFNITVTFERDMDTTVFPQVSFPVEDPEANTLTANADSSYWLNAYTFVAAYDVANSSEMIDSIDVRVEAGLDKNGELQEAFDAPDVFNIETQEPVVQFLTTNDVSLSLADTGSVAFRLIIAFSEPMDVSSRPLISFPVENPLAKSLIINSANTFWVNEMYYQASYDLVDSSETLRDIDVRVTGASDLVGNSIGQTDYPDFFSIDTEKPEIISIVPNLVLVGDPNTGTGTFSIQVNFSENMDMTLLPQVTFPVEDPLAQSLTPNAASSAWVNSTTYEVVYDVADANETLDSIDVQVSLAFDAVGNPLETADAPDLFHIDTENPATSSVTPNIITITDTHIGAANFVLSFTFSEEMDSTQTPAVTFPMEDPLAFTLQLNPDSSGWISMTLYEAKYDVRNSSEMLDSIDVRLTGAFDLAQNETAIFDQIDLFHIETENPSVLAIVASPLQITDAGTGMAAFYLEATFSEAMDTNVAPDFKFPVEDPLAQSLSLNTDSSKWLSPTQYRAAYDVTDANEALDSIDVSVVLAEDLFQNSMDTFNMADVFHIDTENPVVMSIAPNVDTIKMEHAGTATFQLLFSFSEEMNAAVIPAVAFPVEDPLSKVLSLNTDSSMWVNGTTYAARYDVTDSIETLLDIDASLSVGQDIVLNEQVPFSEMDVFSIAIEDTLSVGLIADLEPLGIPMKVYPNPIQNGQTLVVEPGFSAPVFTWELFDAKGQSVLTSSTKLPQSEHEFQIQTADLAAGIYVLKVWGDHKQRVRRIVIQD
ncbi:MAG: DUF6851 domain-containing protein [Akkermansiaceae bacterium]